MPPDKPPTLIIGISGPSSSGKTTLARLLHRIFNLSDTATEPAAAAAASAAPLKSLLIHEDDFYHPDDKIPLTTLPNGTTLQNWDTADALDLAFLAASLSYIRSEGRLPPRLRSKEDQNDTQPASSSDSTSAAAASVSVEEELVGELQGRVRRVIAQRDSSARAGVEAGRTIAFMEGFLLFAPPAPSPSSSASSHPLREVHDRLDGRLFLPAAYDTVKERRERRSGYVTIGAAPAPPVVHGPPSESLSTAAETPNHKPEEIDLEAEDDRPPQNFWKDPPGYVDDIVWPNYVKDHAWLLLPAQGTDDDDDDDDDDDRLLKETDTQELVRLVGQGTRLRRDAGVTVAPGRGDRPMAEILEWAVEEVLRHLAEPPQYKERAHVCCKYST
ncbi:ribosylnicotinamide kinase [Aspergillus saccharolyticus JOP 1030-1]|uniref:Nicotinamide riboside kinase n=1 Tax=Aspergillus saccharolyticus JOP 1030-1 TaxID=1450539 RepID=A0A318ZCR4_9EURO|nr:hypothetical protein BP01DRAFT_356728 [Aspergillus saccharolyticus JOP 1030-1]PYH45256.1 hypothetical protein BP01DRAFT_356728 [Aspergillus saccharolyticus JOP 1030-1]